MNASTCFGRAAALLAALTISGCIVVAEEPRKSSGTVSTASQQADATFTVDNQSSQTIVAIHVSPSDELSWGPDLLGGDVLSPGERGTLELESGTWDIKCESETGQELVYSEVVFGSDDYVLTLEDE